MDTTRITFVRDEREKPLARGKVRSVSRAEFFDDDHSGHLCVIKSYKNRTASANCRLELSAADTAQQVLDLWNERRRTKRIVLNPAARWVFDDLPNRSVLVEMFLRNFHHWNSNSGWVQTKSRWGRVMQALSHYSYHVSNGESLLCDLQGSVNEDGEAVITNPVVCSRARKYGHSDLGTKGIRNFFANHECNEYCSSHWIKPKTYLKCLTATRSTTFWDASKGRFVSRRS